MGGRPQRRVVRGVHLLVRGSDGSALRLNVAQRCLPQLRRPEHGRATGLLRTGRFVYRKGNCPDWGYQWLKGSDHLMKKNEYIPRPGDLVFFSYNQAGDTEHVALVEYCARNAQGDVIVHVIEGNNPSTVQRNRYPLNNSQMLGFGACEDVADTTIRTGCSGDKVLALQQQLTSWAFLRKNTPTGTFGSNTKRR